jgi:hypothetical protein
MIIFYQYENLGKLANSFKIRFKGSILKSGTFLACSFPLAHRC